MSALTLTPRPTRFPIRSLALALALLLSAPLLQAAQTAELAAGQTVTGRVLEVRNVTPYTYLRIQTALGEQWAVVDKTPVTTGASVSVEAVMAVRNFESKSLGKTFPHIVFGHLAGAAATGANPHEGVARVAPLGPARLAKATGPNAYTVADIHARAAELRNKPVRLSAKVVKFSPDIMGKNWLHLQDGSGHAAAQTHDILATTQAPARVGEVLTVTGTVQTNIDLGMGYTYKVLINDATLVRP